MSRAQRIRQTVTAITFGLGLAMACADGGVVGGDCNDGYKNCDGVCIAVAFDNANCGACGNVCDPSQPCVQGVCGGGDASVDGSGGSGGSSPDGSDDGDGTFGFDGFYDGKVGDGRADGADGDGGEGATDGSVADGSLSDSGCVPPYNTPSQCGDCFTVCSGQTPVCAPSGGSFVCVPLCDPPLVACGGTCVDLNSDPNHCGACFNKCPSGICQAGQCVGAVTGHIVLSCMNYAQASPGTPQTMLLGNAALLPVKDPVRILAYDQYAPTGVQNKVDQTIGWAASAKSRTFNITTVASSSAVVTQLNVLDYDVFLVYDQPNAPAGQLGTTGFAWANTLAAFTKAGGVVVGLMSGTGTAEMDELFTNASLLAISGQTSVTGSTLYNQAPADAVGVNVLSPFLAVKDTCKLTTSASPSTTTVFVIGDSQSPTNSPVVVHRIALP